MGRSELGALFKAPAADISLSHGNSNSFSAPGTVAISVPVAIQHFETLIPFTVNGKKDFNSQVRCVHVVACI